MPLTEQAQVLGGIQHGPSGISHVLAVELPAQPGQLLVSVTRTSSHGR
jgi:hypothetical protein